MPLPPTLRPTDALLIIDLQNDFCPDGSLPVQHGDAIVPLINTLTPRFPHTIFTQDWHPSHHISFASTHPGTQPYQTIQAPYGTQTLWPDHCLQHSPGADLHPHLHVPPTAHILRKGFRQHIDSYSAFLENDRLTPTGLADYLHQHHLTRLFLCGLAYDFCVRYSAIDGHTLGFETIVLEDATRAVNLSNSVAETHAALAAAGIPRIQSTTL